MESHIIRVIEVQPRQSDNNVLLCQHNNIFLGHILYNTIKNKLKVELLKIPSLYYTKIYPLTRSNAKENIFA